MLDSKRIKEIMFALGADLCGIASIDRFDNAPKGYHPLDVLPTCKSVISFVNITVRRSRQSGVARATCPD